VIPIEVFDIIVVGSAMAVASWYSKQRCMMIHCGMPCDKCCTSSVPLLDHHPYARAVDISIIILRGPCNG